MTDSQFKTIFNDIMARCQATLAQKKDEYTSGDDRLSQFKNAGKLMSVTPVEAVRGLMVKHTTSIYDLISHHISGKKPPKDMWVEKIVDHINYLILLYAVLHEEGFTGVPRNGNETVSETKS